MLDLEYGRLFLQVDTVGLAEIPFPRAEKEYRSYVERHWEEGRVDELLGTTLTVQEKEDLFIVLVFGQETAGHEMDGDVQHTIYEALVMAFEREASDSENIFFPLGFGAGLAGGNWAVIRDIIDTYFPNATIVVNK